MPIDNEFALNARRNEYDTCCTSSNASLLITEISTIEVEALLTAHQKVGAQVTIFCIVFLAYHAPFRMVLSAQV